jgi:hypothetical protein
VDRVRIGAGRGFDRNDGLAGLSFRGIEKVISGKLESAK